MAEFDSLRLPPQDLAAEQAVLGAIFLDNHKLADVAAIIDTADFYQNGHRLLFSAMLRLEDENKPIDALTVQSLLSSQGNLEAVGGIGVIADLANNTPTSANAESYAEIVREKSQLRQLISRLNDGISAAYEQEESSENILAAAEKELSDLAQGASRSGFRRIADIVNLNFEELEKRSKQTTDITGLSTGFEKLDAITTGLHDDELLILAARPGVGKTAFALNVAQNIATKQEVAVALFSLEMGAEQLVDRLIASESMVDSHKLRTGRLEQADWEAVNLSINSLGRSEIYIDDSPGLKMSEIRAKSRNLANAIKDNRPLKLIVIDYLQLISGNGKGRENRQQEVSEISRQLKILAKELHLPVIALSQLSRGVEASERKNKRPRLSDLRDSGSIEQDADIVAFLYREDYYIQEGTEPPEGYKDDGTVEIILEKNRSGARGTAKVKFVKQCNKFMNLDLVHEENGGF